MESEALGACSKRGFGGNVFCDSFETRNISPPAAVGGLMDKTIRPDARNRVKPRHRSIRVESDCN